MACVFAPRSVFPTTKSTRWRSRHCPHLTTGTKLRLRALLMLSKSTIVKFVFPKIRGS